MPGEDAARWDRRYIEEERFRTYIEPRPFLVKQAHLLPTHGIALDVAMGLGGNAGLMLERGLKVVGVDISGVAVRQTHQRLPGVLAVQADMTCFHFPPATFDVILNFYFLQRDLWPEYNRWLRPGGVLFIETMTRKMLETQPDIDPLFLLETGELGQAFSGWDIVLYQEGWQSSRQGHPRAVASMVARTSV